ncbi:hypothetical protein F383_14174 [Gossypium arboreum]|uniref:Uncharacterized protein n=1 Tax=Gossypium arboreum TaxID=29729 RepID=A0A0B0MBL1_GOSAR|nr:hypothetical protein F383_14174 [Gossypium arboreum]
MYQIKQAILSLARLHDDPFLKSLIPS